MDKVMTALIIVAVGLALTSLVLILADTLIQGVSVINLSFLASRPVPVGYPGGGIGPDIQGTVAMVGMATLISVPVGVGAGIFFSEWPESRLSALSSFSNDVLAEFPSMVIGIFVYAIVVLATRQFSAFAGGVALSIIMIPIVARTTEESLKIVPRTLREASMALGVSRWKTVLRVVMSTGRSGLITGILLAIARATGETAPLIVTAGYSTAFLTSVFNQTGSLPYLIYYYAISPYTSWHAIAWGAALILIIVMLVLNLSVKLLIGGKFEGARAEI